MVFKKCLYGCMCVCVVCVCARACVCVCVCVCGCRLDLSFYSVDFNLTSLIFFFRFFLCDCGSKIRFFIGPMRFCFI